MKVNHIKFKQLKNKRGRIKGFEMSGFDVWESFTKRDAIKIAWFLITKVILR